MSKEKPIVYPYIPNSVPAIKDEMLQAVGAASTEEFYEDVPEAFRTRLGERQLAAFMPAVREQCVTYRKRQGG